MKVTTYKGGGRNTVPRPGADLPDIRNSTDLERLMSFYNILGHGTMSEEAHRVFLVPDNTWILFITRAGIPAEKRKSPVLGTALDDFTYLKKGETHNEWYHRIYKAMEDGSLFKTILYNNSSGGQFSIYEPGDLVQDLELQFTNDHWPLMRLGVWRCPMPTSVLEKLTLINDVNEMIKYNPSLQGPIASLEAYKKEKPASSGIIEAIVHFLKKKSDMPGFEAIEFLESTGFKKGMEDPIIKKHFEDFMDNFHLVRSGSKMLELQYSFFDHENNLLNRSPSIREGKLNSSLYNLLFEKKLTFGNRLSNEDLLDTRKYRFIVVDACRSIEDPLMPEILYKPRAALTRSLSNIARPEVCIANLLQMTKQKFAQLIEGKQVSDQSAIMKLLQGQVVLLSDFEASLVGKNASLRTFLEHQQFKQYDPVFVNNGTEGYSGLIANINMDSSGKLVYKVIPDVERPENQNEGGRVTVPASSVYATKNTRGYIEQNRELEHLAAMLETHRQIQRKEADERAKAVEEATKAARQQQLEAERNAAAKAREVAKEKEEEENRATFVTHQALIDVLDNKDLIKYGKRVKIQLPEPQGSQRTTDSLLTWNTYNNREGYIKKVLINEKTKTFQVFVAIARYGGNSPFADRAWNPKFLVAIEPKKGGARKKTRRSKKSKKQRHTRRH